MRVWRPCILGALVLAGCAAPEAMPAIPDLVREGLPPGVSEADVFQADNTCWYYRAADGSVRLARAVTGHQVCTETG